MKKRFRVLEIVGFRVPHDFCEDALSVMMMPSDIVAKPFTTTIHCGVCSGCRSYKLSLSRVLRSSRLSGSSIPLTKIFDHEKTS